VAIYFWHARNNPLISLSPFISCVCGTQSLYFCHPHCGGLLALSLRAIARIDIGMQSGSISNALQGNTPIPVAASLLASVGQLSSPFAALFQSLLKSADGIAKLPAPGKPKDAARAQDVATPASSVPQIACPLLGLIVSSPVLPVQELALPASGTTSDSAPSQDPSVAPASPPSLLSSIPQAVPSNGPSSPTSAPVAMLANEPLLSLSIPAVASSNGPVPPILISADAATNKSSPTLPNHFTDASQGKIKLPNPDVAPPISQRLSSNSSVQPDTLPIDLRHPLVPNMATFDVAPRPQTEDVVPIQNAPGNTSSTDQLQNLNAANAPQSDSKVVAPKTAGQPYIQTLQAVRAGLEFMNLQSTGAAQVPANPLDQIRLALGPGDSSKVIAKFQPGAAVAVPTTPVQTAGKMVAVGVPAPAFHDTLPPLVIHSTQSAPNAVASSKLPSKDPSSGSQANDANTKSDRSSNPSIVHSDGKGFGQSLDTASANAGNARAATTDSNVAAANVRVPVEAPAASADPKPDVSRGVPLTQGQSLPATSAADQPIVSGARLTDHPGQTEIRIEMQAGSLGAFELRAHVSGDQIGASIAVEHHDVQMMLMNDLPALHSALAEKNLHFNTLSVSQGTAASMGGGAGGDTGQRGFVPSHPKAAYGTEQESSAPIPEAPAESVGASHVSTRLSVHA
jgi:hypothetical protein